MLDPKPLQSLILERGRYGSVVCKNLFNAILQSLAVKSLLQRRLVHYEVCQVELSFLEVRGEVLENRADYSCLIHAEEIALRQQVEK